MLRQVQLQRGGAEDLRQPGPVLLERRLRQRRQLVEQPVHGGRAPSPVGPPPAGPAPPSASACERSRSSNVLAAPEKKNSKARLNTSTIHLALHQRGAQART